MYHPVGLRPIIEDVYNVRNVEDLLEDHKANPVIRLDIVPNTLVITCLNVLAKTFCTDANLAPDILKFLPHFNYDLFLHILPTNAPLTTTIPLITSETYWERCCEAKWPNNVYQLKENNYKQLFCEQYLAEFLQKIDPGFEDYEEIKELQILLHKYIKKLRMTTLSSARKRGGMIPADCLDVDEIPNRLDIRFITAFLPELIELHLSFGMDNPTNISDIRQAVLLEAEIENIGEALVIGKNLTIFKITSSYFKGNDLSILYHYIIESNIMVLDFSNCFLSNSGAQIAALLIKNHSVLLKLNLSDNDIGPKGGYALAYALTHKPKAQLRVLDLTMNPIGDEAGCCLATVLAYHPTLEEIYMAGTRLHYMSGDLFAKAIELNHRIKVLNLCCNTFSRDNAIAFLNASEENPNIINLDLRSCGFAYETLRDIRDILFEHREAKRVKMISQPPKSIVRVKHLKNFLDELPAHEKTEPVIYDPIPHYGSHRTSSLTLSDHGQLTVSTLDSTSSASSVSEKIECTIQELTEEVKEENK